MKQRILWIEDETYIFKGIMRPLKKDGFQIDTAGTAYEGYELAKHWEDYDLIVIDLIIPLNNSNKPNEITDKWGKEKYSGVSLIKSLRDDLQVGCPIVVLTIVDIPLSQLGLEKYNIAQQVIKYELDPKVLRDIICKIIEEV